MDLLETFGAARPVSGVAGHRRRCISRQRCRRRNRVAPARSGRRPASPMKEIVSLTVAIASTLFTTRLHDALFTHVSLHDELHDVRPGRDAAFTTFGATLASSKDAPASLESASCRGAGDSPGLDFGRARAAWLPRPPRGRPGDDRAERRDDALAELVTQQAAGDGRQCASACHVVGEKLENVRLWRVCSRVGSRCSIRRSLQSGMEVEARRHRLDQRDRNLVLRAPARLRGGRSSMDSGKSVPMTRRRDVDAARSTSAATRNEARPAGPR